MGNALNLMIAPLLDRAATISERLMLRDREEALPRLRSLSNLHVASSPSSAPDESPQWLVSPMPTLAIASASPTMQDVAPMQTLGVASASPTMQGAHTIPQQQAEAPAAPQPAATAAAAPEAPAPSPASGAAAGPGEAEEASQRRSADELQAAGSAAESPGQAAAILADFSKMNEAKDAKKKAETAALRKGQAEEKRQQRQAEAEKIQRKRQPKRQR